MVFAHFQIIEGCVRGSGIAVITNTRTLEFSIAGGIPFPIDTPINLLLFCEMV